MGFPVSARIYGPTTPRYNVSADGTIQEIPAPGGRAGRQEVDAYNSAQFGDLTSATNYSQRIISNIQNKSIENLKSTYEQRLADVTSRENAYNTLAEQISALGGLRGQPAAAQPAVAAMPVAPAVAALSGDRNFATSDLANKLNFQVSDQQILDDYNNTRLNRLNQYVQQGNAQIAGIQQRLTAANTLLGQLPQNDPRRTSSQVVIDQLNADLASVQSGVADATAQIKDFKPIAVGSQEGARQITSFREYLQLPEERATQQLRQIDPEAYRTAVGLGRSYRQMATTPLGPTTTPQTEALRSQIEEEALNQLRLGATLGAEERRQYEQAARAAQTARGNIFGVAPAVEEAVTTGQLAEQRKLARYGAAAQFLGSGETTGAALARDVALRDALTQSRLGAAAGFIAGGPSLYNLAQARTGGQQAAFQNYIQATQPIPGQFGQAPSTAQPFFQIAEQGIPVALQNAFANLYGSQASYQASTYGNYVGALANTYRSPFQNIAALGGAFKDVAGGFGGLASAGILCWVAREVYGEENPRWMMFREWMLNKAPKWFLNLYIKFGERFAGMIRNMPNVKRVIRIWMDSKIGCVYGS